MQRNLIVIYAIAAFGISLLSQPVLAGAAAQMNASAVQSQATVDGDSTFTLIRGRGVHGMRGGHVAYRGGHAIGRGHGVRTRTAIYRPRVVRGAYVHRDYMRGRHVAYGGGHVIGRGHGVRTRTAIYRPGVIRGAHVHRSYARGGRNWRRG